MLKEKVQKRCPKSQNELWEFIEQEFHSIDDFDDFVGLNVNLRFADKGLYHWLVSIEINQPYLKKKQLQKLPQIPQVTI